MRFDVSPQRGDLHWDPEGRALTRQRNEFVTPLSFDSAQGLRRRDTSKHTSLRALGPLQAAWLILWLSSMGFLGSLWGFGGVIALLGTAVYRLIPRALEAFEFTLTVGQWIFLVLFALFMLVGEGYRGFQKRFSPRTAARVKYLYQHPRPSHVILAPLFCMGFFFAKRKTRITAVCLALGIILLVVLVRFAPQPWRGSIDFGVALGLSYGIVSLGVSVAQAMFSDRFEHSPEIPE